MYLNRTDKVSKKTTTSKCLKIEHVSKCLRNKTNTKMSKNRTYHHIRFLGGFPGIQNHRCIGIPPPHPHIDHYNTDPRSLGIHQCLNKETIKQKLAMSTL